ncbi:Nucleotide-binding universal stress protein, UspA family [Thermodesulfobium acidiphilum]|uniref:Nucleotide-binding universal stress protein, UspA family n=1 Tax=Thermodesulfobium acidiphilum TaxID=1794699 RepID=A0A2R4W2X9_THEAF|nr:universal stress protein [Thermodesulfobium acidiphilum]AWB11125.1 Nucleotide-binding universal stress protein, UspA family [Thermodesulfobium acidiphilum]
MKIERVVVALDFSEQSSKLFNAVNDFKRFGISEIHLVHVVNPNILEVNKEIVKIASDHFSSYINNYLSEGVNVFLEILIGNVVEQIRDYCDEINANLLFASEHGEGFFKDIFVGSNLLNFIRTIKRPIYVERFYKTESAFLLPENRLKKVLFPTDFSKSSMKAFDFLKKISSAINEVLLVHVLKPSDPKFLIKEASGANKAIEKLTLDLVKNNVNARYLVLEGNPAKQINSIVEKENISMIIMSRRGLGFFEGLFLGSVAEYLLFHTRVPILFD